MIQGQIYNPVVVSDDIEFYISGISRLVKYCNLSTHFFGIEGCTPIDREHMVLVIVPGFVSTPSKRVVSIGTNHDFDRISLSLSVSWSRFMDLFQDFINGKLVVWVGVFVF